MTRILQVPSFATPCRARSRMRPGVATTMWTGWCRRMMSSRRFVPPVDVMICSFKYFPRSLQTWAV